MDKIYKMQELLAEAAEHTEKAFTKKTASRHVKARNRLSQITKLCKELRAELLEHSKALKEDDE